ncbi:stress responsive alpha/beta barrel protein [Sphaerotilus hippei]|uniref:Stress responsive alpha/beta barrel protein n=1 Tax=Sphaerotilus hippei TaxID=744406 RepID=A0A318H388_9BURK|nr:Dabb family protein [Sphaerotilus hippei]PXW97997.1 stress responsive alpha/beta barrel protein [Sphaerotilus hippei]
MIRHIVMWGLKDPAQTVRFRELLESCRGLVPGMVEFDVGSRATPLPDGLEASCEVVLVSTFDSLAALQAYQDHPTHRAVGAQLGPMRSSRQVMDYEF